MNSPADFAWERVKPDIDLFLDFNDKNVQVIVVHYAWQGSQSIGPTAFTTETLTDAQNLDLRLRASEPIPLKEAKNLVPGVGLAQWVEKLGVRGEVLFNSGFQLVRVACRAERLDNIGYLFLRVLHVGNERGGNVRR